MKQLIIKHREKLRFLVVAAWNTLFGYLLFLLLYFLFSSMIHYMIILVLCSVINITQNYLSYKFLVFKTKGNYLKEYFRFYMVYGVSLSLNMILLPVCVELLHIHPIIAQTLLTVLIVMISYVGHKNFSFRAVFKP